MSFLDVGGRSWETLAVDRKIVHMGHNCNQLPIHPSINDAMIDCIRSEEYRNYAPPYGLPELRDLIREDLGVPGVDALVTNGSTEAIYQAISAVIGPGDEVIVSDPSWPHIANFARGLGATVISIPIYDWDGPFRLTPDSVAPHITNRTRLIAIVDPLNPLGTAYTGADIESICALADRAGAFVLHDSTYRDYSGNGYSPALLHSERAMVAVSMSKSCGFAGLRAGALLAHPSVFGRITERHISRLGVSWVVQRGAIAAMRTKPEWLPAVMSQNLANQERIKACADALDPLRIVAYPPRANFVAIDVSGVGCTASAFVTAVVDEGVIVRDGVYTSSRFGERFIRATTTVPESDVARFVEALPGVVERLGAGAAA